MPKKNKENILNRLMREGLAAPIFVLIILSMITIPLPPIVLDIFFTSNIILSLIVLMICLYARRPLDFSIFPTVILFATLLRLGLNVASTRVILIHGQNGGFAAGHVIESFGKFVIGGNYAVGLVVFMILVIINFIVITKGAERVSEVNARFTLDSLPGKQMAIDADLNSGFIDQEKAGERRKELAIEAEFHGSMDGASKFVKGDAIAGIAILLINLIGGFAIGILQHNLSLQQALQYYITLSIGDGLAAQIPSLILSTATAVIITRVSHLDNLMGLVSEQMFSNTKVLAIVAGVMTCIGVIPGMPNGVFLTLAIITGSIAYFTHKNKAKGENLVEKQEVIKTKEKPAEVTIHDIKQPKTISLEIGYRLINLITPEESSELLQQLRGIRKELSKHLGFLVHPINITDNIDIEPNQYCIKLRGNTITQGVVMADLLLALDVEQTTQKISGINTTDPTFGLDAVWIRSDQQQQAESYGYNVVDSSTVVATHVRQTLLENADELLSYNDVYILIEEIKLQYPKLIDEFVPKHLNISDILRILRNLLKEQVPITNFLTICETLAEYSPSGMNNNDLTQVVRKSMSKSIVENIVGSAQSIEVFTLDPELESILQQGLSQQQFTIEPTLAQKIHQSLATHTQAQLAIGKIAVLLTSPLLRSHIANFMLNHIQDLHILSYDEIPPYFNISIKDQISATQ